MGRRSKIVGLNNDDKIVKLGEKVENENVSDENKVSFKVYWSDQVFTDPILINYYKIYLRELIDMNKLLGKFDNDGNYSISVDIKRELVRMYKDVFDTSEGFYRAKAVYMEKEFDFTVEINLLEDGNAQADLYINEQVVGAHETTFKTFVASFVDKLDASFNLRLKRAFKLVDSMPVLHDTQIPNIAILLQGQIDNGIFLDELIELGSQKFLLRMLEELENCGDVGRYILDTFKERMQELDDEKSDTEENKDNFNYKHKVNKKFTNMRRLLDEIVDEKGGYQNLPIEKNKFHELFSDFNKPVEQVEKLRETYQGSGKGRAIRPNAQANPKGRSSAQSAGGRGRTSSKGTSNKKSNGGASATSSKSKNANSESESTQEKLVGSYHDLHSINDKDPYANQEQEEVKAKDVIENVDGMNLEDLKEEVEDLFENENHEASQQGETFEEEKVFQQSETFEEEKEINEKTEDLTEIQNIFDEDKKELDEMFNT